MTQKKSVEEVLRNRRIGNSRIETLKGQQIAKTSEEIARIQKEFDRAENGSDKKAQLAIELERRLIKRDKQEADLYSHRYDGRN